MPVRFPAQFPLELPQDATPSNAAELRHGNVLLGKVTRIASDGQVSVRFPTFEAKAHAEELLDAGRRVFAHVRQSADRTIVQLLANVEEGEILQGTALSTRGHEVLARFGEAELAVRPSHPGAAATPPAEVVRAQLQVIAGKPLLQMLPVGLQEDSISGTVIAQRDDGSVLLKVAETVLIARTAGQPNVGDTVHAALQHVSGRLVLEIAPEHLTAHGTATGQLLDRLLALPQYFRLFDALTSGALRIDAARQELLSLLEQFSMAEAGKAAWVSRLIHALQAGLLRPHENGFAENLARAVSDSGLFLEPRLLQAALSEESGAPASADLKAALLLAQRELAQSPIPSSAGGADSQSLLAQIAPSVGRLLDALTAQQFLNVRLLPWGEIYIQLPFAPETALEYVELRVSHRQRQGKRRIDPRNVQITLAVSTSKLGRVKAAVSIVDGQISCQFRVARREVAELLDANAETLRDGLEKLDYRVTHIGCMVCRDGRDLLLFEDLPLVHNKGFDVRA